MIFYYLILKQYLDQATRSTLIQLIITELKRNTIQSDEFLKFISEYLSPLELAKQFLHELNSFCLSTSSSLIDYDSKCKIFFSFFKIMAPISFYLYFLLTK